LHPFPFFFFFAYFLLHPLLTLLFFSLGLRSEVPKYNGPLSRVQFDLGLACGLYARRLFGDRQEADKALVLTRAFLPFLGTLVASLRKWTLLRLVRPSRKVKGRPRSLTERQHWKGLCRLQSSLLFVFSDLPPIFVSFIYFLSKLLSTASGSSTLRR